VPGDEDESVEAPPARPLRRGWTTGTCAAAGAKAAYAALLTGEFPDPVEITLPRGERPAFALATQRKEDNAATAGIIKDAGDDPDVTHGALILATVRRGAPGAGVTFRAGEGVGTVTRPGLVLPPGEPAINPVPRRMIRAAIEEVAAVHGAAGDVEVEVSIPGGEALAARTVNARLGIIGGLSILGTTGIVVPYSCAAWIHSIHRGIDVALIDMGDFVGGMLKFLRTHPIQRVTIACGVAKMTKLAQGMLDLHSKRGAVDLPALAAIATTSGGSTALAQRIAGANTTAQAFADARAEGISLGDAVAALAWDTAAGVVADTAIEVEIILFDRDGTRVGRAPFRPAHEAAPSRKRRR